MTHDSIGHLKMLCVSVLSLSGGVESAWKRWSSPLSLEKSLASGMNPAESIQLLIDCVVFCDAGNPEQDKEVKIAITELLGVIKSFNNHFNESQMFQGNSQESSQLKVGMGWGRGCRGCHQVIQQSLQWESYVSGKITRI